MPLVLIKPHACPWEPLSCNSAKLMMLPQVAGDRADDASFASSAFALWLWSLLTAEFTVEMDGPHNKVALITGITGQDGSYLAELLLAKGYVVHGIKRRISSPNLERIQHLLVAGRGSGHSLMFPGISADTQISLRYRVTAGSDHAYRIHLHFGDVTDFGSVCGLITKIRPGEVYNLAAQSHVQVSFELPSYTADVAGQVRTTTSERPVSSVRAFLRQKIAASWGCCALSRSRCAGRAECFGGS